MHKLSSLDSTYSLKNVTESQVVLSLVRNLASHIVVYGPLDAWLR